MAEYIEREALKQSIRNMPRTFHPELVFNSSVQKIISNAPAADVVEVRHGEWERTQFIGKSGFYNLRDVICSECKTVCSFLYDKNTPMNYCPNCGAKIDGKDEKR